MSHCLGLGRSTFQGLFRLARLTPAPLLRSISQRDARPPCTAPGSRKLVPLGPITLATTTAPLLAGGLSLLSGGLGSRTIVSPLPTHQTWPSHRLAGPKSACSPHRGRHDDKRPHGIDEGRRQPPASGSLRDSATPHSASLAPPIAVGARDRQWLGSHRPRHRTTATEPQQRRKTTHSHRGLGERVPPD